MMIAQRKRINCITIIKSSNRPSWLNQFNLSQSSCCFNTRNNRPCCSTHTSCCCFTLFVCFNNFIWICILLIKRQRYSCFAACLNFIILKHMIRCLFEGYINFAICCCSIVKCSFTTHLVIVRVKSFHCFIFFIWSA